MWITIRPDGSADRRGIETPTGTCFHAITPRTTLAGLLPEPITVLAIKVPGHSYWASYGGPRGYQGAEVELYRVEEAETLENGVTRFRVERICEVPVKGEKFNQGSVAALVDAALATK